MDIQELANKVCGHLVDGYVITLRMEHGSAYVELEDSEQKTHSLDAGGESLEEQINEALCMANGFSD